MRSNNISKRERVEEINNRRKSRIHGRAVVRMTKEGGIYTIPVELNGVPMRFIFDTGASIISISAAEAIFMLKQGTLEKSDFVGTANFVDANGDISEGTLVMLKSVKLGDVVLENVKASIVHNTTAPLLLGQSALAKFGKISIDYDKSLLILE